MREDWSGIEKFRFQAPGHESNHGDQHGLFVIPFNPREDIVVTFEIFNGWEHAAIKCIQRRYHGRILRFTPDASQMQFAKSIFWNPNETVVQFHGSYDLTTPNELYALHLWRHQESLFCIPPKQKEEHVHV